jgi:hypothetical protein
VIFEFFTYASPQEISMQLLYTTSNTGGNGKKRERKYVGRLERVLFIRVTLSHFDRYNRFQLANRLSILPTTSSQQDLALKGAPNERPRYFKGREETLQPKMLANSSILFT